MVPKPISIKPNRRTVLIQLLLSLLMLVLCVFLIFTIHVARSEMLRYLGLAIGILGPPLFLIAIFFLGKRYFAKAPVVVVDKDGIRLNTGVFYSTEAKWSDITQLGVVELMRRKYFVAMVKDPKLQIELAKGMERRAIAANVKRFKTPIVIAESAIDVSAEEFLSEVSAYSDAVNRASANRAANP